MKLIDLFFAFLFYTTIDSLTRNSRVIVTVDYQQQDLRSRIHTTPCKCRIKNLIVLKIYHLCVLLL